MREKVNPWDMLVGALFGVALSMMVLSVAGLVEFKVGIGGQVLGVVAIALGLARLFNLPPFRVVKNVEGLTGNNNG